LDIHAPGSYQIQAAISALHARARTPGATDWSQIAALYRELDRMAPSPIVRLNGAVAVGMAHGPLAGLTSLERLHLADELDRYFPYHAARADLLRRAGYLDEARASYASALELCQNRAERAFFSRRLVEISRDLAAAD
jgi:RNA polymerase sigma-70 factor, ECF subfamily